jgi:hypothetical protein
MTVQGLDANDLIIEIPESYLMTAEKVTQLYLTQLNFSNNHDILSDQDKLSIFLVVLKLGLLSKTGLMMAWPWKDYLSLLPSTFPTLPLNMPSYLQKELPLKIQKEIQRQEMEVRRGWEFCVNEFERLGWDVQLTLQEYTWAWSAGNLTLHSKCKFETK